MFGYVGPDKPELKVREYEMYRAYYCAVCKAIGRRGGQLPRLVLSHDLTFLALILDSLDEGPSALKSERCVAHPTRRHQILEKRDVVSYAADMNVLLAYENLRDKWRDNKNLVAIFGACILGSSAKKAAKNWPVQADEVHKQLKELAQLEANQCESADEAAEPFAKIMEALFSCPLVKDVNARNGLAWLGYNLGRWIYLLDAYDDMEEDVKGRNYNPLLLQYKYEGQPFSDFRALVSEELSFSLFYSLSEADKALKVLDVRKNEEILSNILESGLIRRTESVLSGTHRQQKMKSR